MPLFNSKRDAGLLLGVNREVMRGFSSVEVAVYQLDLNQTDVNIYEESNNRAYQPPIRLYSQVILESKTSAGDNFLDFTRTFQAGFLREDLIEANVYLQEGDIIEYDGGYYEIDQLSESNYWSGRNPETSIGTQEGDWVDHGYVVSVVASCHLTRTNRLQIVDKRTGIEPGPTDTNSSIPTFL